MQQKKLCSCKNFNLYPKPKCNKINKELSQFHLEAAVEKLREPKFFNYIIKFCLGENITSYATFLI